MDTVIKKRGGISKKYIPYIIVGIVLLIAAGWLILGNHTSRLNVDNSALNIQTVQKGEFNDYVRINGQVQPISTIQLSAAEGGLVAEKLIEEGAEVRKGDIILRLTNSKLSLDILDSEAQLAEKQNFLRNTQVSMEQEKLNLKKEKLQLDMDVERKKRKYEQYKQLHQENLVSKEDYLQAKEDYEFAVDGRTLVVERQKQDSIYRGIQIDQMEESLHNIRKNLGLVRQRIDDLNVRATIDGQLGLLDVEVGQTIRSGDRIGQIHVLSDYKVEAMIDELYIDRVKPGLDARVERQDQNFSLRVRKVYPEVREKQFKTDFVFEGEKPDQIRTGQAYHINLQLGQPVEAVYITRGMFYQTTGGRWIYVVSSDGRKAVKRNITIGRQNPNYYEVISGLEPGEKVIVSAYDNFGDAHELVLK